MTFASSFGRVFSPTFQPKSQAAAASSWWLSGGIAAANCIAAYQAKGAVDYAGSKVNLANPGTYDAADGAAYPTWDSTNGWKFAHASNHYLKTGVIPENDQTWSMIFRFSNADGIGNWTTPCGMWQSSGIGFAITNGPTGKYGFYNGGFQYGENTAASGVLAVAGKRGYYNGVNKTGDIGASGAAFTYEIYIGGPNNAGSLYQSCNIYIQAFALFDGVLTPAQVAALTTAMNAL